MAYEHEISREHPVAMIFLIDQSTSMEDPVGGSEEGHKKAEIVADALNRLLVELGYTAAKREGIRDWFHISVIGYGATTGPAFEGPMRDREQVPISELAQNPAGYEERTKKEYDGAGDLVEHTVTVPVWVYPVHNGATPMHDAFTQAYTIVEDWLRRYPSCFPPIVLNITDGEYYPAAQNPAAVIESLASLASSDGNVLLFNLHISDDRSAPIVFPDSADALPDEFARQLFTWSSVIPPKMREEAAQKKFRVSDGMRGFVFNASIHEIIEFLDLGTRGATAGALPAAEPR